MKNEIDIRGKNSYVELVPHIHECVGKFLGTRQSGIRATNCDTSIIWVKIYIHIKKL